MWLFHNSIMNYKVLLTTIIRTPSYGADVSTNIVECETLAEAREVLETFKSTRTKTGTAFVEIVRDAAILNEVSVSSIANTWG